MRDFIREFWSFMLARKKLWLLPIVFLLLLLAGIIIFSQGNALAPAIYTLF